MAESVPTLVSGYNGLLYHSEMGIPRGKSQALLLGGAIAQDFVIDQTNFQVLIGFEHMTEKHTGKHMAGLLHKVLEERGLIGRLFCITTDNAKSNDTLREELEDMLNSIRDGEDDELAWDMASTRIPCLAHIIQLSVKAFLGKLGIGRKVAIAEEADDEVEDDTDGEDVDEDGILNSSARGGRVATALYKVR